MPRSVLGPDFQQFDPSKDMVFGFISSGTIYHGQWVKVPVTIGVPEAWDGTGQFPTAVAEVFAVDRPADFSGGMFGVGFAIEKEADGGPARNPFLHLTYAGEALTPKYIISQESIDVGLTRVASDDFSMVVLERNAADDDWLQPTGILGLDVAFAVELPILIDMGLQEMLVFLPVQDRPAHLARFSTLPDGVRVSIRMPALSGGRTLDYTFVTGGAGSAMAPSSVQWRDGHGINTGRNVLAGADYLFDAASGLIGLRAR